MAAPPGARPPPRAAGCGRSAPSLSPDRGDDPARHVVDPALARLTDAPPDRPRAAAADGCAVERDDRPGAGDAAREKRLVGVSDVGRPEASLHRTQADLLGMPDEPGPHRA